MSTIDNRIVDMQFNREDFLKGTEETISALGRLEGALTGQNGIANGVRDIGQVFSVLGQIGMGALLKIGSAAVDAGMSIVNNVLNPIREGGKRRAMNLEQANFMLTNLLKSEEAVKAVMDDVSYAVTGTAFGLDAAAVAAAQFAASGVEAGEGMRHALRGISGVAAMGGREYEQVANIFTKVAGQGRLMGDDLNRIGALGINAAQTLAEYFNKLEGTTKHTEASIRKMVTEGQIDFATFAAAMDGAFGEDAKRANEMYSGSLSNVRAALSRVGAAFYEVKHESQRRAFVALIPVIDKIAGALTPLVKGYTRLSKISADNMVGFLERLLENTDWTNVEGIIHNVVRTVEHLREAFVSLVKPITDAFAAVFFTGSGAFLQTIRDVTLGIRNWSKGLALSEGQASKLGSVFENLFRGIKTIIDRGLIPTLKFLWDTASDIVGLIGQMVAPLGEMIGGLFSGASGSFSFADGVEWVFDKIAVGIDYVRQGFEFVQPYVTEFFEYLFGQEGKITTFFQNFQARIDETGGFFQAVGSYARDLYDRYLSPIAEVFSRIGDIIEKIKSGSVEGLGDMFRNAFEPLEPALEWLEGVWQSMGNFFSGIRNPLEWLKAQMPTISGWMSTIADFFSEGFSNLGGTVTRIFDTLGSLLSGLGSGLTALFDNVSTDDLMALADALGKLALIVVAFRAVESLRGMFESITGFFGQLGGAVAAWGEQFKETKSDAFLKIAVGIGIIAASLWLLAKVPAATLWNTAAVLGVMAGAIGVLVWALSKIDGTGMAKIGFGMTLFSTALFGMATTLIILGLVPFDVIKQGGIALGILIAVVTASGAILGKMAPSLHLAALGLIAMAGALTLLLVPITILGNMDQDALAQGIMAVAAALLLITAAGALAGAGGPQMLLGALGIVAIAGALALMIIPIQELGAMDHDALAQGLIAVAVALLLMTSTALALQFLPLGAIGLIAMAGAFVILAAGLHVLSSVPWEGMKTGLIGLAIALVLLTAAAAGMQFFFIGGLVLAAILLAFAVAAIAVGAGALLMGVGAQFLAGALPALSEALVIFSEAIIEMLPHAMGIVGMGIALGLFAVGATAAGIGATLLGVGLLLLGVALPLIATYAESGAEALLGFVDAISPLIWKTVEIGIISATLTALGASLLVLGTGMAASAIGATLLGVAAVVLTVGLTVLIGVLRLMSALIPKTSENFQKIGDAADPVLNFATALGTLTPTLILFAEGALRADTALRKLRESLLAVVSIFGMIGFTVSAAGIAFVGAINAMTTSATGGALRLQVASRLMANAVKTMASGISGHSPAVSASVQLMIDLIVSSMNRGSVDVGTASNTITQRFVTLAVGIAVAGLSVVASVRRTTQGMASELRTGTTLVLVGVAMLAATFVTLASRISQNGSKVTSAARQVVSGIPRALNGQAGAIRSAAYNTGLALANGMVGGINAGRSRVSTAARSVAQSAINAANNTLGVRSPSRVFYSMMGFVIDGMVNSLGDGTPRVEKAAESVSEALVNAVEEVYRDMPDMDELFGFSPTITPILDLDEARRQADGFRPQMGFDPHETRAQAYALAGLEAALRGANVEKTQEKSQIIFNQNNHSPKALSESEIYRQTKNLISRLEEREGKE